MDNWLHKESAGDVFLAKIKCHIRRPKVYINF